MESPVAVTDPGFHKYPTIAHISTYSLDVSLH